jgi:hypothetical protein
MNKVNISPYLLLYSDIEYVNSEYCVSTGQVKIYSNNNEVTFKEDGNYIIPSGYLADQDDLTVELSISINNAQGLFADESSDGVVPEDAKLGLALFWESKESGQRGVGSRIEFGSSDTIQNISLTLDFPKKEFRSEVSITPRLFLAEPSQKILNAKYCSTRGSILGDLSESRTIILDGDGSTYPLYEVSNGLNEPLWRVYMNWSDPLHDSFFHHFKVTINRDHPDYESVKRIDNPIRGQDTLPIALKEIITSTLFAMLVKLKEDQTVWQDILENKSSPQSVGKLAWCFVHHLNWSMASYPELLQDIRNQIQKQ